MKAAIKYGFHPSIIAIKQNCNLGLSFSFSQGERDEITLITLRQIEPHKAQTCPQSLLRKILIFFGNFVFRNYNNCVSYSIFPNSLKYAIITPIHEKRCINV